DSDSRPGVVATLTWDESIAPARDLIETFAGEAVRVARANDLGTQFLLIGSGPDGAERVHRLGDALLATADLPIPMLVHVQGDAWRQWAGTDWSEAQTLPEVRAAAVAAGQSLPAPSRAEFGR